MRDLYLGNTRLHLRSSGPLDYESYGPGFRVDVLVENRHYASTKAPLKAVVRIDVKLFNVEDEKPIFCRESLFNVLNRNADLRSGFSDAISFYIPLPDRMYT